MDTFYTLGYGLHNERMAVSVHAATPLIILSFTIIARVDFIAALTHIEPFSIEEGIAINYDERIF